MFSKKVVINAFCEFGPVFVFIATFKEWGFSNATISMVVAVLISLVILKTTDGHVPMFAIASTSTVAVFGSFSYFMDIPTIFILRDTLFDLTFGTVTLISIFRGKPLFKYIFNHVFAITDAGWMEMTKRWCVFFFLCAATNEYVRQNMSPEQWVPIKIGMVATTVVFGIYQFTLSRRERLPEANSWGIVK